MDRMPRCSLVASTFAMLLLPLGTLNAAEPPQTPPTRLPTSPAEVAEVLMQTDAAEARMKELITQRNTARNAVSQALNALRNGPFKATGGLDDPEFKRRNATVTELDARMRET